ncbi:MAG: ATP-binding protein [Treponemataceae bacterium]|nr:ATP-binding protein [Treponemataceae bacterium]
MITVPVLSTTEAITHALSVMETEHKDYFKIQIFNSCNDMEFFIRNNFCELIVIDFTSNELKPDNFYDSLKNDKYFDFLNILVIVSDEGERMALEMETNPNLLLCINEREFLRNCTRLFKIFMQNIQFLFNKVLQTKAGINGAGTLICDNDSADIVIYADLIVTYLTNTGKIDMDGKFLLQTSLMEMLLNALEHGNCNITYDEKTHWLESGHDILELIAERNIDPDINSKKITLDYNACITETYFAIKDEGLGFDWRAMLKKDILPDLHGMGIKMTERMVKELSYNEKGNEVYFCIENSPKAAELEMENIALQDFKKGDKICSSNAEQSAFLISGSVNCTLANDEQQVYKTDNILLPLYKASEGMSFAAAADTRLLIIDNDKIKKLADSNEAYKTLFERIANNEYKRN